jgi:quercetin dioxygenase-like cupin family protein
MVLAGVPIVGWGQGVAAPGAVRVTAGQDRLGKRKDLGISTIDVKMSSADSRGAAFVIENTNRAKGGPARHLHVAQEELFYVIEGEYVIEVGADRFTLKAGDSLMAPRQVPHVWARTGEAIGRLLITFTPPGRMEAFFDEVSKAGGMPPQDPALWRAHGMELVGPPLPL